MSARGLLQTEKLSLGYRQGPNVTFLFRDLDLTLSPGKLVCMMGPNGAGKSTLIRTLAGLQEPLSGRIRLPLAGRREENISVVLTDRVAGNMKAADLVAVGRYPYTSWSMRLGERDREAISAAMERVHIGHLADKNITELSDGEMQLVMIARALAQDTPVMLLDEPTAHLDLSNRVVIMNVLLALSRSTQKAILMTTHDLDLTLQMADSVWLATPEKNIRTGLPEDMILDGSFEAAFHLTGYDLKTGKIKHPHDRKISVRLTGEEPAHRWTKNALERNGFEVTPAGTLDVRIERLESLAWRLPGDRICRSLEALIAELEKNG